MTDGRRAALYLTITGAGFGGTWVAAPWATEDIAPLVVACIRFAIAALLLLGWCSVRRIPLRVGRADLAVIVGVAVTSVVGYNVLFLYGVTLAPASHGAVLVPGLIPMATLILSRLFLGTHAGLRQIGGILLSIAGLALVVGPELTGGSTVVLGDGLFIVSAAVWASYTLVSRGSRLHPVALTFYGTAIGSLALLPLAVVAPGGGFATLAGASGRAVVGVLYLGSIGTVVSFVTFLMGVRLIGPARATAYSVLIPIFGLSLTVTLLGESLTPLALVGAAVVLVGLRLTQTGGASITAPPLVPPPAASAEPA